MKNLKYIIIIIIVIIVLVAIFAFSKKQPENTKQDVKKKEIDNLFAIWMNIAGPGDRLTLTQQEAVIKKDLFDKLNDQEVLSLKDYSMAIQNFLSVKSNPLNPLFISSVAYLTTNFGNAKQIIAKTVANSIFVNLGINALPTGIVNRK
jgi:hypothetical protein